MDWSSIIATQVVHERGLQLNDGNYQNEGCHHEIPIVLIPHW